MAGAEWARCVGLEEMTLDKRELRPIKALLSILSVLAFIPSDWEAMEDFFEE